MSKKEESRFNIRFNPSDPTHQMAIEILSHVGRSKANLIANSIAFYLRYSGDEGAAYLPKSLSHGKMPKIKSEKRRVKKPPKSRMPKISDSANEHEVITSTETVALEIPQDSASLPEENENSESSTKVGYNVTIYSHHSPREIVKAGKIKLDFNSLEPEIVLDGVVGDEPARTSIYTIQIAQRAVSRIIGKNVRVVLGNKEALHQIPGNNLGEIPPQGSFYDFDVNFSDDDDLHDDE
jgi:hypothetical protein